MLRDSPHLIKGEVSRDADIHERVICWKDEFAMRMLEDGPFEEDDRNAKNGDGGQKGCKRCAGG